MKEALDFIYEEQKELSVLGGIAALLGWDQMTYMPQSGATDRSEQGALISKLSHKKVISDTFWNHILNLTKEENYNSLEEKDKAVVSRLKKDVEKSRKVPSEFVVKLSKSTTLAYQAWEEARNKNDFKVFSPHLQKIVDLEKEYCGFFQIPGPRYNTLLDDYEEGMTVDKLRYEFKFLKEELVKILERIKSSEVYQKQDEKIIELDEKVQKNLSKIILEKMQLPENRSRIDVSTHPFTTSMGYDDVRITTSYSRKSAFFSFFSTIHEAGHALYELKMPQNEYKNTVISDSPSLGLHESQSRFWENMIARNKHFWSYFFPIFTKESENKIKGFALDEWYRLVNLVKPSLIRVEADELTYCLHVILRFEIETDIMDDKISISELPEIWNEKMDEFLHIRPKNDVEGILQDMHWSGGSFGYFPTYAIGTIYASQIFEQICKENPLLYQELESGEFGNIINWLNQKIHKFGRLHTADEIIKNCCGEGLNSKAFVDYLKDKYYKIYEV